MTSIVSRDDVEAVIWRTGIRDPRAVAVIMKAVDAHIIGIKRTHETMKLMEPFGYLAPGESDLGMEVTKCKQCEIPRKFGQFHADKNSPTGHRDICKHCYKRKPLRPPDYELEITCTVCGDTKKAEPHFYRRSDTKSGYGRRCKDCTDGVRKCPVCGKRRRPTSFTHPDACVWCENKP